MGIPGYPFRIHAGEYSGLDNEETPQSQSQRSGLARWLSPLFGDEASPLCQACCSRKLDFRPLTDKPPGSLRNVVDDDDLETLENKHAVHINDFLLEEAKAMKSECSLCRVLYFCADSSFQDGYLLKMRTICILRPRYDWSRHRGEKGRIIHRNQVWVHFQPIENGIVFDMVYTNRFMPTRKGRSVISATIDIKLLRYWLRQCDKKHSHPAVPNTLGSRMQSIMSRGLFRVINTSTGSVETLTSPSDYVALSYVWGPTADQSSYKPLESKPISAHAPTIRDAAVIANSIGFKWLWVDRICIDQTSGSEKAILIPYMKDIFSAAQLTIVAGCGDGAQSGLLGSPETPRQAERPLVSVSSVTILRVALSLKSLMDKTLWSRRGWTFEEYVFSRRLLFFLSSEVLFNCGEYTFRESMGCFPMTENKDSVYRGIYGERLGCSTTRLHRSLQNEPANMAEVLDIDNFISALGEYTERNLTVESDRVAAVAGVVIAAMKSPMDEVSERTLLRHGHPLHFFEILLTWEQSRSSRKTSPLPNKPFAPSWSWASSPMQVWFNSVRNRLLMDPDSYWFQYSPLHNHDILGLPTNNNSIGCSIGLQPPDELIADQPWMRSLPGDPALGYEAGSSTDSSAHDPLALPKLHMVTLVFDARFICGGSQEHKHILASLGSTETSDGAYWRPGVNSQMYDSWSIHPQLEPRYFPERIGSGPQPFETFAIITGRVYCMPPRYGGQGPDERFYDLYILLLDRAGSDDIYTRVGMARLCQVNEGSYFFKVISNGRPRWEYIRIV